MAGDGEGIRHMIIHVVLNAAEVSRENKNSTGVVFPIWQVIQMNNCKQLLIGRI